MEALDFRRVDCGQTRATEESMTSRTSPETETFDITWRNGAYYVSVPNYQGGTVYTSDHVASLKAHIVRMERALNWIVNSPSAHPANMVMVAEEGLRHE
jgi:hypothetical protein